MRYNRNAAGTAHAKPHSLVGSAPNKSNYMKTSLLKTIGLFAALTSISFALPISGSIGFTGPYTVNNSDLTIATSIIFDNGGVNQITTVGVSTGSFAGIAEGTAVTMFTPLQVNGVDDFVTLPAGPIWSVGGFSLTLTSISEQFNSSNSLNLYGVGVLSDGNSANDSMGEWIATFNRSGTNFTFSASSSTSVPDGSTTVILLGLGLAAIGVVSRRTAKA